MLVDDLKKVMKEHPTLTASGVGVDEDPKELLQFIDACDASCEWLSLSPADYDAESKNRWELSAEARRRTVAREEVWKGAIRAGWCIYCGSVSSWLRKCTKARFTLGVLEYFFANKS